mgnify:FL=1
MIKDMENIINFISIDRQYKLEFFCYWTFRSMAASLTKVICLLLNHTKFLQSQSIDKLDLITKF